MSPSRFARLALNAETGKLLWYYQHLPGDDWDQDYTNERILLRTSVNPDTKSVKWINPSIAKNSQHDISVSVGEGGGLFALDRSDGKFLWAMPFPYDTPRFLISIASATPLEEMSPRGAPLPCRQQLGASVTLFG